jgi:hypothetical protein
MGGFSVFRYVLTLVKEEAYETSNNLEHAHGAFYIGKSSRYSNMRPQPQTP